MMVSALKRWRDFFAAQSGLRRGLLFFGVFTLAFALFYFGLRHLAPVTLDVQDVIFGSDTQEIVEALRQTTFENDMRKHVLFSFTLAPVIGWLDMLPMFSFLRAMRWVLALLAALNVLGLFFILQAQFPLQDALLFSGWYAFAFANLVTYSIPETYAMSNLMIMVYLLAVYAVRDRLDWRNSLGLSALAGLAALYNTPLLALAGIHILMRLRKVPFWEWVSSGLGNLALAGGILLGVNLLVYGVDIFSFWRGYSSQWASPLNLLNPGYVATVFVDFLLFSMVSPVPYLPAILGWQDWPAYWQTPVGALLSLAAPAALIAGLAAALRKRHTFEMALLAWVGVMILFYIYFNPLEAMLYASQILAPLVITLARGFADLPGPVKQKRGVVLVLVTAMAIHNLSALLAGVPGI